MAAEKNRMKASAEDAGVFESDAPDGYVALLVVATNGRQLLRLEIAEDCYSVAWIKWLERWFRRWNPRCLKLVK